MDLGLNKLLGITMCLGSLFLSILFELILELDSSLKLVNSFSMSLLESFLVLGYGLNLDRISWSTLLNHSLL
jgi:hypothetical protein